MSVRADRAGLADPPRDVATGAPPRPRRPAPALPANAADLPRFLRATARLGDLDHLASAYAVCDAAIRAGVPPAGEQPDGEHLAELYSLRSSLARRRGDLAAAERDGATAAELAGDRPREATFLLLARRIAVRLDAGDVAGAEELLDGLRGDLPEAPGKVALRYARGRLNAAAGRPGEGLADLFHCGERLATRQADRPSVLPWRSSAATVLAATGATESAVRLVRAEVALNRQTGTASALGRSLRVQGVVLPGAEGLAALAEAHWVLMRSPRRFEYATALVDFGLRLNALRRRPQARRMLREGMELAAECGSPALAAHARAGYAAAGGKLRA
jgi:tetratricopeptide (TPR) repeat protein